MPKEYSYVHPGVILGERLEAFGISIRQAALAMRIPVNRPAMIVNGKSPITAEMALRLGRFFGTSTMLWMTLQLLYDLEVDEAAHAERIHAEIQPFDQDEKEMALQSQESKKRLRKAIDESEARLWGISCSRRLKALEVRVQRVENQMKEISKAERNSTGSGIEEIEDDRRRKATLPDWRTMEGMAEDGPSLTKVLEEERAAERAHYEARINSLQPPISEEENDK